MPAALPNGHDRSVILAPNGLPARVDLAVPAVSPIGELAVSDTRRGLSGSFPSLERYNPDELARKGGNLRVYDQMQADEQVKACLLLKKAAIVGPGWDVVPGDEEDDGASELAEAVKEQFVTLEGRTFTQCLYEMLSALAYGYSLSEIIWQAEPQFRLRTVKPRAPHDITFEQDAYGNVLSIVQQRLDGRPVKDARGMFVMGTRMPPLKFIHFTHNDDFDNPFGTSDLRAGYTPWFHKTAWRQFLAIWGEKLADQPVVAKHPQGLAPEKVNALIANLEKLQAKSVIAVPVGPDGITSYGVELLESNRNVRDVFLGVLDHFDLRIARALLVPDKLGLAGGEVKGGSFALGETQFDVFLLVLEAIREKLAHTIQRRLVEPLTQFLGGADATRPQFQLQPLTQADKQKIAALWLQAVGTPGAVTGDVRDENHLRELLDWPQVEEAEEELRSAIMERKREQEQVALDVQKAQAERPPPGKAEFVQSNVMPTVTDDQRPIPTEFWRALHPVEERADLAEQRSLFEAHTLQLRDAIAEGSLLLVRDVQRQAGVVLKSPSAYAIATLRVDEAVLRALTAAVEASLRSGYEAGAAKSRREVAKARNVELTETRDVLTLSEAESVTFAARGGLVGHRAQDYWQGKAFEVTGLLSQEILRRGKHVLMQSLRQDKTPGQVLFELAEALGDFLPERDSAGRLVNVPARLETIARTNIAESVNEGRWATFADPDLEGFVTAVRYSAILDDRTTDFCRQWDGVTRPIDDGIWFNPDRRPPNHFQCRSVLVPVTAADTAELTPESEVPLSVVPPPGFK